VFTRVVHWSISWSQINPIHTIPSYLFKIHFSITELLGLFWTLSIVLYVEYKKSHNVSDTGSVSVLRWIGKDKPTQLGPLERASLNHWTVFHIQDDG
jgi:hypothetical protein